MHVSDGRKKKDNSVETKRKPYYTAGCSGITPEIKITSPSATDRTYFFILLIFILECTGFFLFFSFNEIYIGNEMLISPRNADKTGIVVVRNDVRVAGGVTSWLKKKLFVHAVGVYRKVIGYRTSRGAQHAQRTPLLICRDSRQRSATWNCFRIRDYRRGVSFSPSRSGRERV